MTEKNGRDICILSKLLYTYEKIKTSGGIYSMKKILIYLKLQEVYIA